MSLRARFRIVLFGMLAVIASCGSEEPAVAPAADLNAIPGVTTDEFVTEFEVALAEINDAQLAGLAIADADTQTRRAEAVPLEIEAIRTTVADLVLVILPAHPSDDELRRLYFEYMDGLETWIDGYEAGANALEAELATITDEWGEAPPAGYIEITDELYSSKQAYDQACSAIADALVERAATSIACIAEAAPPSEN